MPRSPFKGEKVYNKVLGEWMHLATTYINYGTELGIYTDMMPVFVKKLKKRISDHYQNVIMIDGGTGSGKSTLGINMFFQLDPDWDMENNYAYTTLEFLDLLSDPDSKFILVDEATNAINSLDSRSKDNNYIVKLLDMMRSFGRTTALCTPNFMALNHRVQNDHTDFLLAIPDQPLIPAFQRRGFYEVFVPKRNLWSENNYWICAGAGVFPPLDPETQLRYDRLKRAHQIAAMTSIRKQLLKEEGN